MLNSEHDDALEAVPAAIVANVEPAMAHDPIKIARIVFACPHCRQKGKVIWSGEGAYRSLMRLASGFHVEEDRFPGARHVIICDHCDEIDAPRALIPSN
jgi:hypothetical protein